MERCGDHRRRSVSGSYTYVGKHTAKNERFGIHGISQRKKCIANISKKAHLCAAGNIRAMPENEIPPLYGGIIIFAFKIQLPGFIYT